MPTSNQHGGSEPVSFRLAFSRNSDGYQVHTSRQLFVKESRDDKEEFVLKPADFQPDSAHELSLNPAHAHAPKRALVLLAIATHVIRQKKDAVRAGARRSSFWKTDKEKLDRDGWTGVENSFAFKLYDALRKGSWPRELFGAARPDIAKACETQKVPYRLLMKTGKHRISYAHLVFITAKPLRGGTKRYKVGFAGDVVISLEIEDNANPSVEESLRLFDELLVEWGLDPRPAESPPQPSGAVLAAPPPSEVPGPPRSTGAQLPPDVEKFLKETRTLTEHWADLSNPSASVLKEPLFTDSQRLIIPAYELGQRTVKNSFRTTTHLRSWLWSPSPERDMVQVSNLQLGQRLQTRSREEPDFRPVNQRLFLTPDPIDAMLRHRFDEMYMRSKQSAGRRIEREEFELDSLARKMAALQKVGCEVRVACSDCRAVQDFCRRVGPQLFVSGQTELALYDEDRLDFFGTSEVDPLTKLTIMLRGHSDFRRLYEAAEDLWSELWNDSATWEFTDYVERLREEDSKARGYIAYDDDPTRWIEKFHEHPDDVDRRIKTVEEQALRRWYEDTYGNDKRAFRSALDIGTHTGRYLGIVRDWVVSGGSGTIVGIDVVQQFVDYAQRQLRGHSDWRISVEKHDFLDRRNELERKGKFDLITCMMATIIHFAYSPGALDRAMSRFERLLAPNGVAVVSCWRPDCSDGEMLSLYSKDKKDKVRRLIPDRPKLQAALSKAGLAIVNEISAESLNLYVIRRAAAARAA
jgi:SAM-dependent methyltransferase